MRLHGALVSMVEPHIFLFFLGGVSRHTNAHDAWLLAWRIGRDETLTTS
jgi:hypothetical protein